MRLKSVLKTAVFMTCLGCSPAFADLIGSSVTASLSSGDPVFGLTVATQFASGAQVVGPGVEFTGVFNDAILVGNQYNASLDVAANSFAFMLSTQGAGGGCALGCFSFELSLPSFVTGVTANAGNPLGMSSLNFASGAVTVDFTGFENGSWEFDVQQPSAAPEPSCFALLPIAGGALALLARKQRFKRQQS